MRSIEIEQITIPYDTELLLKWKARDESIVPAFMLDWNGPGINNGYGFGEWMAGRYFENQGYHVFVNEFDLLSTKSKFRRYNEMMITIIGTEELGDFREAINGVLERGYRIENPDLFVFDLESCFFIEVKKGKDKLREPQIRFIYLAKEYFGIESKLLYLCDKSTEVKSEKINFEFDI